MPSSMKMDDRHKRQQKEGRETEKVHLHSELRAANVYTHTTLGSARSVLIPKALSAASRVESSRRYS